VEQLISDARIPVERPSPHRQKSAADGAGQAALQVKA
jgi:hypothetical protein